jgi:hypothetical protein
MKKQFLLITFLSVIVLSIQSCKKEKDDLTGSGSVKLEMEHLFGSQVLNTTTNYTNQAGEQLTISTFNYYLSNFVFVKEDGTEFVVPAEDRYKLVRHNVESSKMMTFNNVPAGKYKAIRFVIGVDSLKSCSPGSERTGDLDVATNGDMYWVWNSGYIFFKLEGNSTASTEADGVFQYHIGGFGGYSTQTINNLKTVELESAELIEVGKSRKPVVHLRADVREMFVNPVTVSIATESVIMFKPSSTTIANNYADMFSIDHVHN